MSSDALEVPFSTLTKVSSIGEGGSSQVLLAEWNEIKVALKTLKSSTKLENISQEAKILIRLRYKFIVTLMGVTTDPQANNHNLIFILEYMRDGSLEDLLFKQNVKMSSSEVIQIALDIAKGLHYLHSQQVIHRDLKSSNVLQLHRNKKRAKICDFGKAIFQQPNVVPQTVIGTIGIAMPPEMMAEEVYDERVDIFSFGVIVYEMLTNARLPILEELHRKKRITDKISDIELRQLVLDCCATDPNQRPNILQVITRLKEIRKLYHV